MRKLQTHDVFMALKLIRAAGVKDEVRAMVQMVETKEKNGQKFNIRDAGMEFIFGLLEKFAGTESENAFYELLSGPLEIDVEEIKTMDPLDLVEKIQGLQEVIDGERFKNFFKSVAGLVEKLG